VALIYSEELAMRNPLAGQVLSWLWFGLLLATVVGLFHFNRYLVVQCEGEGACIVFDRLTRSFGTGYTRQLQVRLRREVQEIDPSRVLDFEQLWP
jgi:hypothetical protein